MKTKLCWKIELRFRLSQAISQGSCISSFEVAKIKPERFSFPPVANRFFRISTVPQFECRGIDSSNTSIRHVTAIVPFICLEFRTFRSQTNQNPDLASFLKWSHNRSNDGRTQMNSTLERHHGRLFQIRSQRCDWNQSGQSDTLLNSSRFGQHMQLRKKCCRGGQSGREKRREKSFQSFQAPFLPARLTAPGSPRMRIPWNSENGLIFSKGPFDGVICEGAYLRSEICVSKSIGLAL